MSSSASASPRAALVAGAATADITPAGPVFLFGYPHVPRTSTGVHDPLECAALYLAGDGDRALFIANDLVFVPAALVADVRRRLAVATGVREEAIVISATHTHSGPHTADHVSNAADPVVPKPDPRYLAWVGDQIVETAVRAVRAAEPAELGGAVARVAGVGTNRHDPQGPTDPDAPVLVARSRATGAPLGCMVVYGMHPTVLHEDSTLISADFPHFARAYLRRTVLPAHCPVVYHNGASGNQSPRHVTRGNTFAEAARIGEKLGEALAAAIRTIAYETEAPVRVSGSRVPLTARVFPGVADAQRGLAQARARYAALQAAGAPRTDVRTAECDVFGAEETAELAQAAVDGRLAAAIDARTPAEIQAIRVGPWTFVSWPGEFFVEYALAVRAKAPQAFVITIANGELQGYIVTPEAAAKGYYEANNALFAPECGERFVAATLALLGRA